MAPHYYQATVGRRPNHSRRRSWALNVPRNPPVVAGRAPYAHWGRRIARVEWTRAAGEALIAVQTCWRAASLPQEVAAAAADLPTWRVVQSPLRRAPVVVVVGASRRHQEPQQSSEQEEVSAAASSCLVGRLVVVVAGAWEVTRTQTQGELEIVAAQTQTRDAAVVAASFHWERPTQERRQMGGFALQQSAVAPFADQHPPWTAQTRRE
jgi:hypothetical protein